MTTIQTVQEYLSDLDRRGCIDLGLAAQVLHEAKLLSAQPMRPGTRYMCDCMAAMHMAMKYAADVATACPGPDFAFLHDSDDGWAHHPHDVE